MKALVLNLISLVLRRKRVAEKAAEPSSDAIDLILSRNGGGGYIPQSRSLVVRLEPYKERVIKAFLAHLEERKAALLRRRRQVALGLKVFLAIILLAAATGGVYAAHKTGRLTKLTDTVSAFGKSVTQHAKIAYAGMNKALVRIDTKDEPKSTPATQQPSPRSQVATAKSCIDDPEQDGCFVGNVIRQGAFLCADGPRPVALEFASSPVRAQVGLSHRDHLAPSTGFATILPTTTRVNYITKDVRVPLDIVAFRRDGSIAAIIPDIPPRRQMPIAVPAADGIVAIRGGEAKRLRITEACQFAAYEEGVPMAPAPAAQSSGAPAKSAEARITN